MLITRFTVQYMGVQKNDNYNYYIYVLFTFITNRPGFDLLGLETVGHGSVFVKNTSLHNNGAYG